MFNSRGDNDFKGKNVLMSRNEKKDAILYRDGRNSLMMLNVGKKVFVFYFVINYQAVKLIWVYWGEEIYFCGKIGLVFNKRRSIAFDIQSSATNCCENSQTSMILGEKDFDNKKCNVDSKD